MSESDNEAIRLVEMLTMNLNNNSKCEKEIKNESTLPLFELNRYCYVDRRQSQKILMPEYKDRRVPEYLEATLGKEQYSVDPYKGMDTSLH